MSLRHAAAASAAFAVFWTLAGARAASSPSTSDRFAAAARLSRGEGVTVAVIATDRRLATIVQDLAPACSVVLLDQVDDHMARGVRSSGRDLSLAASIDVGIIKNARIIFIAFARRGDQPRTADALARARAAGILLIAPAGDEGLSLERCPARERDVVAVAAVDSSGALSDSTNAGARTSVAAPGLTSFEAAARVTAAAALAFGLDASLTAAEARAALAAGMSVGRASPRGSEPALLDPLAVLERLRPRSRAVFVTDLRVVPRHVPRGGSARLTAKVRAVGRLPARGAIDVSLSDGSERSVSFGPLAPGDEVERSVEFVSSANDSPVALRTTDGGVLAASIAVASVRASGLLSAIPVVFDVVPAHQRAPSLRLVSAAASEGLSLVATVENDGSEDVEDSALRLVSRNGTTLAESEIAPLRCGGRSTVELAGSLDSDAKPSTTLAVALELVRRPRGFHETVEERWPLRLDTRDVVPVRRGGSRR